MFQKLIKTRKPLQLNRKPFVYRRKDSFLRYTSDHEFHVRYQGQDVIATIALGKFSICSQKGNVLHSFHGLPSLIELSLGPDCTLTFSWHKDGVLYRKGAPSKQTYQHFVLACEEWTDLDLQLYKDYQYDGWDEMKNAFECLQLSPPTWIGTCLMAMLSDQGKSFTQLQRMLRMDDDELSQLLDEALRNQWITKSWCWSSHHNKQYRKYFVPSWTPFGHYVESFVHMALQLEESFGTERQTLQQCAEFQGVEPDQVLCLLRYLQAYSCIRQVGKNQFYKMFFS